MKKCKGGCQMRAGGKTCMKCGCDMEDEEYEKEEKEMKSGGMACMKCGGKMHKSGGTVSSCMKCGGGKYTFGGKVGWSKKKVTSEYASGGMIKRADGSYSQRGLWDNIRANAGSGKKPTKQMLEQEKKIKSKQYYSGGAVSGMKQYIGGGEVARTGNRNADLALTLLDMFKYMKESKDKSKYTGKTAGGYDYYRDEEGFPVVNIPDSEIPYDKEGKYDDQLMVKSAKVANTLGSEKQSNGSNTQLDYSLPNWGYAKMEQKKLNELIQAEMKAGAKDLELLVEDDIIGEKTLAAMNKFEGKGYTRPEGFKDKWLKKYAEDYARGVRMQVPGVTAPVTPKVPGKESAKTTEVKVEEDIFGDFITKTKTEKDKKEVNEKPKYTGPLQQEPNTIYFPSLQKIIDDAANANKNNIERDKQLEQLARDIEAEYETEQKQSYKNFGKKSAAAAASAENLLSRKKIMDEELKLQESAKKNFGKRSAKASAESIKRNSEKPLFDKSYIPSILPSIFPSNKPMVIMPTKENILIKNQPVENQPVETQNNEVNKTFKGLKDILFEEEKNKKLEKADAQTKYMKKIYDGSKTIMNIDLKTPNTKEDILYNINSIDDNLNKIEKALEMLSGPTVSTTRKFNEMTSRMIKKDDYNVGQKYKNIPNKPQFIYEQSVSDDEYNELLIIKTFLDRHLDKIYKDPKYKNLDETDKKAVLSKSLFNKRIELSKKQFEMKKQLK